jgi:hypothetical protein
MSQIETHVNPTIRDAEKCLDEGRKLLDSGGISNAIGALDMVLCAAIELNEAELILKEHETDG